MNIFCRPPPLKFFSKILISAFDEIIAILGITSRWKSPADTLHAKNYTFFRFEITVVQRAREGRGKCWQQWALSTTCCSLLRALCGLHFTENSPKSGGTEFHHDKYQLQSITAVSSCQIHPLCGLLGSPTSLPARSAELQNIANNEGWHCSRYPQLDDGWPI